MLLKKKINLSYSECANRFPYLQNNNSSLVFFNSPKVTELIFMPGFRCFLNNSIKAEVLIKYFLAQI